MDSIHLEDRWIARIQEINPTITKLIMRNPPDSLFHYTTIDGLLGIVQSKTLWASQIQYLNDSVELYWALNLAREILESTIRAGISPTNKVLLEEMTKSLMYPERNIVFVCSFSEEGDLLSQWKGCCSPGPGFSIGFTKKILPLALEQGFFPVP